MRQLYSKILKKILRALKDNKLLTNVMSCTKCSHIMRWIKNTRSRDGYIWKCNKCNTTKNIRDKSLFQKTRTKISDFCAIIRFWSLVVPAIVAARIMPKLDKKKTLMIFTASAVIFVAKL